MPDKRDYYEVLDISRDASPEDVKKAFRQQALKFHPDRNKETDAADKFKEVNEAYQVLSDPERRSAYDRFGHAGVNGSGGRGFEDFQNFGGFGDIFDAFFGGSSRQGPRRGADLEYQTTISFMDSAFGSEKEFEMDRLEKCSRCDGQRAEPGTDVKTCVTCHGSGQVKRVQRMVFGQFQQVTTCSTCAGTGKTYETACKQCRGRGSERKRKKIAINIPAGIEDGSRIVMRGQGEPGELGGPPGDLYVHVNVEEDERFQRHGNDILTETAINVAQAALGATVTVPTLEGEHELKIPAGTQTGKIFRIRHAGMPHVNHSDRRGDQLVAVKVATPTNLSAKQKKLLEELAESLGTENIGAAGEGSFFGRIKDAFNG
jgi:molecular chaperone DnaJ